MFEEHNLVDIKTKLIRNQFIGCLEPHQEGAKTRFRRRSSRVASANTHLASPNPFPKQIPSEWHKWQAT